jgi:hypothetical protein
VASFQRAQVTGLARLDVERRFYLQHTHFLEWVVWYEARTVVRHLVYGNLKKIAFRRTLKCVLEWRRAMHANIAARQVEQVKKTGVGLVT